MHRSRRPRSSRNVAAKKKPGPPGPKKRGKKNVLVVPGGKNSNLMMSVNGIQNQNPNIEINPNKPNGPNSPNGPNNNSISVSDSTNITHNHRNTSYNPYQSLASSPHQSSSTSNPTPVSSSNPPSKSDSPLPSLQAAHKSSKKTQQSLHFFHAIGRVYYD